MSRMIRRCPKCHEARHLSEVACESTLADGEKCLYPLLNIKMTALMDAAQVEPSSGTVSAPQPPASALACPNGHEIEPGDRICIVCNAQISTDLPSAENPVERTIDGWQVLSSLESEADEAERFRVRSLTDPTPRLLRYFSHGVEPETRTYPSLQRIDTRRVSRLIAHGRTMEHAYEVWDEADGISLRHAIDRRDIDEEQCRTILEQCAEGLDALASQNLRHGNLTPTAIRMRSGNLVDIEVCDLSTALLAEFQLEVARAPAFTRYLAPEAIAGSSSLTSDWWSLGVILLELLTQGRYFESLNDRAFLLHVIARGLDLPESLTSDWRLLLQGLLTRDHSKRWGASEVKLWLAGRRDLPTYFERIVDQASTGPALSLGGKPYRDARSFSLAAAQAENWDEALALTEMGSVATWLAALERDSASIRKFKQIMEERRLSRDARFALALLVLNEHLPLSVRGDIQTPNRLLESPGAASVWFEKPAVNLLVQLKREPWIVRLAERAGRIQARAEELGIALVEERFRVTRLAAFESRLEEFWRERRQLFPDATNPGISTLLERRTHTDEELILLICADDLAFQTADQVLAEAGRLSVELGLPAFDAGAARHSFKHSKRQLVDEVDEKIGEFKRIGHAALDEWADTVRLGRRIPLTQLLILNATDARGWEEPAHQDYLRNVLEFLQKKILSSVQRGPLVKLGIGRSASRIDLIDLGPGSIPLTVVERALARDDQPVSLSSPSAGRAEDRVNKLRNIAKASDLHRRETGVSALVVAFPLIVFEDRSLTGASAIRIAPLALWPVKLIAQRGEIAIAYDVERDPEPNPALDRVLGSDAATQWRNRLDAALRDNVQRLPELLAVFHDLAPDTSSKLSRVPDQSKIKGTIRPSLVSAGAVMLADFPSQAIFEDLRSILTKNISDTALECILRIREVDEPDRIARPKESERFTTLDADPSQEEAVLSARQKPGLRLEGPPGTGKSQTIVNIITDCLGRNETVMLVCEKQAALEVVHKRLRAEGLGGRVVRIENTQSDRKRLLEELQRQIPEVLQTPDGSYNEIRTRRQETAVAIDQLEEQLTAYHEAVFTASDHLGLSYRDVVARIAALEDPTRGLSVPEIRPRLGAHSPTEVERISGECLGLLESWFEGDLTNPSLQMFRIFATDSSLQMRLADSIRALQAVEDQRRAAITAIAPVLGLGETTAETIALWWDEHGDALTAIGAKARRRLASWRDLLGSEAGGASAAREFVKQLNSIVGVAATLPPSSSEQIAYPPVESANLGTLSELADAAPLFAQRQPLLAIFSLKRAQARGRVRKILKGLGLATNRVVAEVACTSAVKEKRLREARAAYAQIVRSLRIKDEIGTLSADALHSAASKLCLILRRAIEDSDRILSAPWREPLYFGLTAKDEDWQAALKRISGAHALLKADSSAQSILNDLDSWVEPNWSAARFRDLRGHKPIAAECVEVLRALPRLPPFQVFRQNAVSDSARKVFEALLPIRGDLAAMDPLSRSIAVDALIRREAAFAWAELLRAERPILASPPQKIEGGVDQLRTRDQSIRDLNQKLLSIVEKQSLQPFNRWSPILNVSGAHAKRLRQVVEQGRNLGIFAARPIWLINPDVASRIFPLEPGLFDAVIFDEASQMRVENAVAALYRAKRVIISGDSKQLPPSTFFGSSVSDEEDAILEETVGADADAESPEARRREQTINRRHIKDCQDLLALSHGVLPEKALTIHYRSAYRELIQFSNAAYYSGSLNIPINRPASEVKKHRPIEVHRIDGVYSQQCNPDEAKAVVDYLSEIWTKNPAVPPTIGVVTFNLKQAELIEAALRERSDVDRPFKLALEREQRRTVDEEDVSFFVRNVENVQGDERDLILFSTTFGRESREPQARFSKNFGVLTHPGGERRLNVAVTRAKHKIVVMTSMPTAEISDFISKHRGPTKARDYLQAYMHFAELVSAGELEAATTQLKPFDAGDTTLPINGHAPDTDALIEKVRSILTRNGFETVVRPLEGAFSVDIAVLNPKSGLYSLGIEFDGPRHFVLNSAKARDIWRPRLLSRQGMEIHRVYSAAWINDSDREMQRLLRAATHSVERVSV
jgi:primosomal replication protein N''